MSNRLNDMMIDDQMVVTPKGKIHTRTWNTNKVKVAEPIILFHDSLGCIDLWKELPIELATSSNRVVIAYDRMGFGKSDSRDELPNKNFIQEEATYYFPYIKEHLSIRQYIAIGHSVGGGMALCLAAKDKECTGVVSISAQAYVEKITIDGIVQAKKIFNSPEQLLRLKKWHGDKAKWVLDAWTEVWLSQEFSSWDLKDSLKEIQCPVLVIHGDKDEYGSINFPKQISENVSGKSDCLILKDCGHIPHREKKAEVLSSIQRFLVNL